MCMRALHVVLFWWEIGSAKAKTQWQIISDRADIDIDAGSGGQPQAAERSVTRVADRRTP